MPELGPFGLTPSNHSRTAAGSVALYEPNCRQVQVAGSRLREGGGLADTLKQPELDDHVMNNVFFDTCAYHQPGIDLLAEVIDTKGFPAARRAPEGARPVTDHKRSLAQASQPQQERSGTLCGPDAGKQGKRRLPDLAIQG
jgi:hypothetical protein